MNKEDNSSTCEVLLYCPISLHFFPNISESDFFGLDLDDLFESSKLEGGHDSWLETIKRVVPEAEKNLPDNPSYDPDYDQIKKQILTCNMDVEIHDGCAWLSMSYKILGPEINISLLKEFAAEQLTHLDMGLNEHLYTAANDGMLTIGFDAADYYAGPAFYNIADNHLKLRHELPQHEAYGQKIEKPSVLQEIREANMSKKQAERNKPSHKDAKSHKKSEPDL